MLLTGHVIHASDPRFYRTLIDVFFSVWLVGSFIGFVLVVFFWAADRVVRSAIWSIVGCVRRRAVPPLLILTPLYLKKVFVKV